MKTVIVLMSLFVFSSSFAFTEKTTFSCANNDQIEVTSSLMPTGQRYRVASSHQYGQLLIMDCKRAHSFWKTSGSQNCYLGQNAMFSFFGQSGMLKINLNGRLAFTICQATKSIR